MRKDKINHPFQAPDNFFDDFKKETIEEIESLPQGGSQTLNLALQIAKYAAIIVFSFFLGRASMGIFNEANEEAIDNDGYSVDEVMLQITDEDIADYIIEDSSFDI